MSWLGYIAAVTFHPAQNHRYAVPRRRRIHVYVDESSQSARRYMVLGAIVVEAERAVALEAQLQQLRELHGIGNELKWGKISKSKASDYEAFVAHVLGNLRRDTPGFYSLVVDTSQMDHGTYNAGDSEAGFSKMVYQLLMKCARLFGADGLVGIDCFLDNRTTAQTLDEFRRILNAGARKKLGVAPFRRVEFRDSKECNLIQAVDLLIGAIAYHWNEGPTQPDASPARVQLAQSVARQAGLSTLMVQTHAGRAPFSIWKFAASPRRAPRRA